MTLPTDTAAASSITDHPFVPRGEWFTTCGHQYPDGFPCGLAEAAHSETTLTDEDRRT